MSAMSATGQPSSSSLNISSLRNSEQIQMAFDQLTKEEEEVDSELEGLLSQQIHLESQLRSLSSLSAPSSSGVGMGVSGHAFASCLSDAEKLSSVIAFTAKLAEGVSVKVKQLDLAKSRVSECQQRVNDLIDLKLCSDGVKSALVEEDYEQAAAHLHRFLAMDEGLLKLTASDIQDPSSSDADGAASSSDASGSGVCVPSLDLALKTLHEAEVTVKEVVSRRFDEAVKQEDLASIERFFKIFPLINMHDEGLKKFTLYLCTKIVDASKSNLKQAIETSTTDARANVIFADTLTLLFEGIARIVEIHQPLIETYYGPGRLITVISMLQGECDRQTERILAEFRKKRNLAEKSLRVKESMDAGGVGGVGGLAASTSSSALTSLASSAALSALDKDKDKDKLSAKDLDHVLSEMALLQARAEMYYKFVRRRVTTDLEISTEDSAQRQEKLSSMEQLLSRSGLCHSMQDLLAEYIRLEDYFMSQNVRKAMDAYDDGVQTSGGAQMSAPDEDLSLLLLDNVFFLMKKCVQRAITGQNVDGVCAVVNNAVGILEQDFCALLQGHLRTGFPSGYLDLTQAYNALQTSFQQGKLQAGDTERQKMVFLHALNNADNATDYIARLTSSLRADIAQMVSNKSQHEKDKVENCLVGLPGVTGKLKVVLEQGLQQLRQSAVKPRIKPWVDSFVSHNLDDDQFADYEANDPFVQTLILNLDGLLAGFKKSLTANNYDALVTILTNEVTAQLEKAVLKTTFSRLGGLLLDREIRSLVSFLTSVTTWSIRDKFARLTQMSTVLNLESVQEITDIWGGNNSGITWRLTPAEVRQILGLRTDFKSDEIKRLRL